VRFSEGQELIDDPSQSASSSTSSARVKRRIPTGFMHPEDFPREVGAVSFAAGDSVVAAGIIDEREYRTVKGRMPTSCASLSEDRCVRFNDGVSFIPEWDETTAGDDRSHSARSHGTDTSSNTDNSAGVSSRPRLEGLLHEHSDDGALSDADTVSSCSSRNLRSRMNTPFMSSLSLGMEAGDADANAGGGGHQPARRKRSKGNVATESTPEDRQKIQQASMVSSLEREISERVKRNMRRQVNQDRMARVMSGGTFQSPPPPVPGLPQWGCGCGGEVETLETHLLPGARKDKELLKGTLKRLVFFEEFEDDALDELAEAMMVYTFEDGDMAVCQGDKDGTHFFVVGEGQFALIRDGRRISSLLPGDAFGESVLMLFGERTMTVSAVGHATAYGMDGTAVRDLLRQQWEQKREAVIKAVDDVLASGKCEMLCKLNAYQLQTLFEKVELRQYAAGDVLIAEGPCDPEEILLLYKGPVVAKTGDAQSLRIEPFGLVGDQALVCHEQATSLVAEGPVEALVLSRFVLDEIFGDGLMEVLVRHRVQGALAGHPIFSQLHSEQLEAVVAAGEIHTLGPSTEFQANDLRFVACLHGKVEAELRDDSEGTDVEVTELVGTPTHCSTFGDENLRRRDAPWTTTLKAAPGHSSAKLVLWRSGVLDRILHCEQHLGRRKPSTGDDADKPPGNHLKFALDHNYKVRVLTSVVLFRNLPMQQLHRLAGRMQIMLVNSGHRIVEQNTIGTHFYIIHRGLVEVSIQGEVVRQLGNGDYFGERALLFNEPRTANIVAVEDGTELWIMCKDTFSEIVQGMCLEYLKDRIHLQDTKVEMEDLEFIRVIGRGGFGIVKMVRHARTGMRYALKCVRKRPIVEKHQKETIINERSILLEVDHPFLVKFVRSFTSPKKVYFLMELVSGGELLDVLYVLGLLNRFQAQFYTGSILLALEFLHSRRIAYLDLKSENCLIDCHGYLKLIDFGIAMRVKGRSFARRGTPMFMAPEMIRNAGYTTVADLWSLGVCLYEFVLGEFPFVHSAVSSEAHIFKEVLESPLTFPDHFVRDPSSEDTIAILRGLLTKDPARRLGAQADGFATIKAHQFFNGLDWDKLTGRELEPPYVPSAEAYAEDKELQDAGHSGHAISMIEEEAADHQDDDWSDPAPGWDSTF